MLGTQKPLHKPSVVMSKAPSSLLSPCIKGFSEGYLCPYVTTKSDSPENWAETKKRGQRWGLPVLKVTEVLQIQFPGVLCQINCIHILLKQIPVKK